MSGTANGPVLWEVDPRGVATVTLNRPEVNNAYNGALIEGMLAALDALGQESGLRAVMIRGNGKHFQAGADLAWIGAVRDASRAENLRVSRATAEAMRRLNAAPAPTVALVQGACFGGGTGIIAACDVVVAADNALFSIAEVRWGLTAAPIIPLLADAIGVRQLRRYATASASAPRRRAASGSRTWWCRSRTSGGKARGSSSIFSRTAPGRSPRPRLGSCGQPGATSTTRRSPRWSRAMPPAASRSRPSRASPRLPRSAPPGGSEE